MFGGMVVGGIGRRVLRCGRLFVFGGEVGFAGFLRAGWLVRGRGVVFCWSAEVEGCADGAGEEWVTDGGAEEGGGCSYC